MPKWDPGIYLKFADERTQPSIDLVHRIQIEAPKRIIDLGCGPGNSTAVLRERWPESHITGLDNSPEMIAKARESDPKTEWIVASAADWQEEQPFDVIFSNAMLHWLTDHNGVCRRWMQQLAPGGALAVQLPAHYDSPLHREIVELSRHAAWNERMEIARNALNNQSPFFYYDTLQDVASRVDLWETTYYHIVDGPEAIVEWFRGTGLRPFLEQLSPTQEKKTFENMLLERYTKAYPRRPNGKVLFPFRRIFFVAYA